MAIYQLFDSEKKETFTETFEYVEESANKEIGRGRLFSTLVTRFCFLLLLLADSAWFIYNVAALCFTSLLFCITGGRKEKCRKMLTRSILQLCRSAVCGLSLFVGLFSPPFGIMIACTYFLMYDKAGMEEVVPGPLQAQFKDIFKTDK